MLSVSDEDASALSSAIRMFGITVSVLVEGVISAVSISVSPVVGVSTAEEEPSIYASKYPPR